MGYCLIHWSGGVVWNIPYHALVQKLEKIPIVSPIFVLTIDQCGEWLELAPTALATQRWFCLSNCPKPLILVIERRCWEYSISCSCKKKSEKLKKFNALIGPQNG